MMKKRIAATILGIALAVNMIACGCGNTNKDGNDSAVENTPQETTFVQEEFSDEDMPETEAGTETADGIASDETVGTHLVQEFYALKAENPDITAQGMADSIVQYPMIQFEGATSPIEEGLLTGFGNAEITGFKEGVMFAPVIGAIPFVGYIFTLDEGADTEAFMQLLRDNANPRWNVCTEAEETVVENVDNMVFFLMCPSQFE